MPVCTVGFDDAGGNGAYYIITVAKINPATQKSTTFINYKEVIAVDKLITNLDCNNLTLEGKLVEFSPLMLKKDSAIPSWFKRNAKYIAAGVGTIILAILAGGGLYYWHQPRTPDALPTANLRKYYKHEQPTSTQEPQVQEPALQSSASKPDSGPIQPTSHSHTTPYQVAQNEEQVKGISSNQEAIIKELPRIL